MYCSPTIPKSALIFKSLVVSELTKKSKGIIAQRLQIELLRDQHITPNIAPSNRYTTLFHTQPSKSKSNTHSPNAYTSAKIILVNKRPSTIHCKMDALKSISRNIKFQFCTDSFTENKFGSNKQRTATDGVVTSRAEFNRNRILNKKCFKLEQNVNTPKTKITNKNVINAIGNMNCLCINSIQKVNTKAKERSNSATRSPNKHSTMRYSLRKEATMKDEQTYFPFHS